MAGWNTVAGYLVHRPGGALARLKGRKRQWYIFDESQCCLLSYKSESDAMQSKPPLSSLDLSNAAISLLMDEKNNFVIHSEGKEYIFSADNHESMMIWVMALQAKREAFRDKELQQDKEAADVPEVQKRKESLPTEGEIKVLLKNSPQEKSKILRTQSWQCKGVRPEKRYNGSVLRYSKTSSHPTSPLSPLTQSIDQSEEDCLSSQDQVPAVASVHNGSSSSENTVIAASSSPAASPVGLGEGSVPKIAVPLSRDSNNNSNSHHHPPRRRSDDSSSETSECDSDSDDALDTGGPESPGVFVPAIQEDLDQQQDLSNVVKEKVKYLRLINSDAEKEVTSREDRTSSLSGNSVSGDSAIGSGECTYTSRLQDLETELMSTKCELAKALNRESSYKNDIVERETMVCELRDQIKHLELDEDDSKGHSPHRGNSLHKMNEKCRILQNHNRFLNEEVLKLSKMLQQEQCRALSYQSCVQDLERELDQLKRDYVFLMQSAIRITSCEGPETMEVYLYGGDRHKSRVLHLLEEAKKTNPSLPSYDSQSKVLHHTDSLGFKYAYSDESLALHYLCSQLYLHYLSLLPSCERQQWQWRQYLHHYGDNLHSTKELKALVRGGIPHSMRSRVWPALYKSRIKDIMDDKGQNYYSNLCCMSHESEVVSQNKRQISLDLLRTLPNNSRFCDADADGIHKLQEVLQAFCLHNPSLGYCQGMNFLVGMCLLFLEPEDAFWCLVAITERYFTANYFDHSLIGAQADQEVLKDLLKEKLPNLHKHLVRLDIELCTITLNWFLAIFFDSVPFETLLRIWDCFLLEGPKVLFRFTLAILKVHEESLLSKHDTVSIMRQLKAVARLCFDFDALIKMAFEGLEPFPRRQDISAKQACYSKALREKSKKREIEKQTIKNREKIIEEMESFGGENLVIECAAVYDSDKIWVCHGNQTIARLSKVNSEENIMYRLNIEVESRVTCMHSLSDEVMLLGTLSHFVHAYSTRTRKLLWEAQLNDAVLSLCSYAEDGHQQVYAGLADGTMAVIENFSAFVTKPDTFYILIGTSPVTCIKLVDKRLWCACGNRILILSARTLDTYDQFQVSAYSLDYISLIQPSINCGVDQGVWLCIRGSSVLQLWDSQSLTCKLLYDVKDNKYPKSPRDEDSELNHSRITALLPLSGSVLVGTAEGCLIIYDVVCKLSRSTSAQGSSSSSTQNAGSYETDSHRFGKLQETHIEHGTMETEGRERNDSGYQTSTPPATATSSHLPVFEQTEFYESRSDDTYNDTSSSQVSADTVCTVLNADRGQVKSLSERDECSSNSSDTPEVPEINIIPQSGSRDSTTRRFSLTDHLYQKLQESKASRSKTDTQSICSDTDSLCKSLLNKKSLRGHQKLSTSLLELQNKKLRTKASSQAMSVDDIPAWLSKDNLSSSMASDSYDFDDFFLPYTEDDSEKRPDVKVDPLVKHADSLKEHFSKLHSEDLTKEYLRLDFNSYQARRKKSINFSETESSPRYNDKIVSSSPSNTSAATGNDEGSTPNADLSPTEWGSYPQTNLGSDTASSVSFSSTEVPYMYEMLLQEKIKISDKPIRCLLETRCNGETTIISCAGCYGDDEAVLKWNKETDEKLWTNDPVIEVCPYTNTIKPSPYARSRMPKRTATNTAYNQHSGGTPPMDFFDSHHKLGHVPSLSTATSVVGSGLAKVQNIFARGHEK